MYWSLYTKENVRIYNVNKGMIYNNLTKYSMLLELESQNHWTNKKDKMKFRNTKINQRKQIICA